MRGLLFDMGTAMTPRQKLEREILRDFERLAKLEPEKKRRKRRRKAPWDKIPPPREYPADWFPDTEGDDGDYWSDLSDDWGDYDDEETDS